MSWLTTLPCRLTGNAVWLSSVILFLVGNIAFYAVIDRYGEREGENDLLPTFRVLLLDGLFLVMGITLGVCIVLVSQQ